MGPKSDRFRFGTVRGDNNGWDREDGGHKRVAVEERKFARLQAAIREGVVGPDDPDFSFDRLRASLRKPGRGRS